MSYRNRNKKQKNRKLTEEEFQQIVSRAFSPDLPEPKFSAGYYQHRQELERKVAMKESKKSKRSYHAERTGKAGFALMTACVVGMAGLAIYSGIGIYNVGRTVKSVPEETQPDFAVGAGVEVMDTQADMPDEPELQEEARSVDTGSFRVEFQCEETDYTAKGGYYDVVLHWVPDGLEYREDGAYGMKYHNYQDETDEHAITPDGVYQVRNSSMQFYEDVDFYESVLETSFDKDVYPEIENEKHMLCVRRGQGFDKVYVHFTGTPYVAVFFIRGFTDEEVEKFVGNMTLVESDQMPLMFEDDTPEVTSPDLQEAMFSGNRDLRFYLRENDYTLNGGAYDLQLNWKPDGTKTAEESCFLRMTNMPDDVSMNLTDVPEGNVYEGIFESQNGIIKHMIWLKDKNMELQDGSYDESYLFVYFEGSPYRVEYVLKGFTREDAETFVDGMTLVESDTERAELYSADQEDTSADAGASVQEVPEIEIDKMNTVSIGDSITIPDSDVELKIQNASFLQGDFTDIATDVIGLPADYNQYLDENGRLYVTRMKESEDGTIGRESVLQYILKLDVTLTKIGTSSANIENGMTFNMEYFSLDDENRIRTASHDVDGVLIKREPELCYEDGFFSFYTAHSHEKNGIYDLQAGESADVTLYYAIDEDMLNSIYITLLDGAIGLYDPAEYIQSGYPVLDLSGLITGQSSVNQEQQLNIAN